MQGPRGLAKKSDWFRCKKVSQKLKYFYFKCKISKIYFLSNSIAIVIQICFYPILLCLAKNFAADMRKV